MITLVKAPEEREPGISGLSPCSHFVLGGPGLS